ncbi:hypothetical protein DPMN_042213 [Dreissena polymorpha]|uniref:Uncharacterized protein n=1 Tax=Dreissena polymorpha TaxID=45954 RepID=A0A9D4D1N7_DREPO|nr:hypothetical protein DPMN_042213 [Dreissena polymorpha]
MIQSMSVAMACSSIKFEIPQQAWQQLCTILVPTVDASNRCVEWDPVCNHFTKE